MKLPVYLDCHATTPLDPEVLAAMQPYLTSAFGNPASSTHAFGHEAQKLVAQSRASVARLIGALPEEIIFTSGATESNNLALKGAAEMYAQKGNHLITEATEHKSVLTTVRYLETRGFHTDVLPVDGTGLVDPRAIQDAVTDQTILISVLFANNEIGTIQPIQEIGRIAKEKGVLFHVDASQAAGKLPMDVNVLGVDLLSFSAHKMYGPKGIGALYVRSRNPRVRLVPQIHGGEQESGLRSGTLNVPGIAGFGTACDIAMREMFSETARLLVFRDRLESAICGRVPDVFLNGHPKLRLANNLNLSFPYVDGGTLIERLATTVAVSSGSACISATPEASYVLKSLGLGPERTETSVRFGLGRFNTVEEIDYAAGRVVTIVNELRKESPLFQARQKGNVKG
jgi:cysteine desulfurase